MIITARKLCQDALRTVGYIAKNESPSSADAILAFEILQGMMDSWRLENLLDISSKVLSCNVAAGQTTVTIGLAANNPNIIVSDFRPPMIIQAFWTGAQNQDSIPMAECKDKELWRSWRSSNFTAIYPQYFVYDQNWPVAKITLYPKPSAALTLNIGVESFITIPTKISDSMDLAPAWYQALKYNLASLLTIELPIPITEYISMIESQAVLAKARIKRARMRPTPRAIMDATLGIGRYSSGGLRYGYSINNDVYNGII